LRDIAVDGLGHVWAVADQHIVEFSPRTLAFRRFDAANPRINVDYFYGIEVEGPTGLCANGAGAVCLIRSSEALDREAADVRPVVSSYLIDNRKQLMGKTQDAIEMKPGQTGLTLHLTTFEHIAVSGITFAYRLEGYHHAWHYGKPGENTIYLGHLPTGDYRLSVRATDRNGCWSKATEVVRIASLPPWYETGWARLLFFIAFVVGCVGAWRLESRIRLLYRLIRRREKVRLNEIELKREDITHDRLDDEFLQKALATVEEHLSEPGFNVEALADALCMSRVTFYHRLQEQTGLTPTEFIRDVRLKKAALLLARGTHATIADVAGKVGFASPKYFSRLFREKFGVLPTQYQRETPRK